MKALKDEITKGNQYFFEESLLDARTIFRFRVELVEAKLNYKNKTEYKKEAYRCDSCMTAQDENTHLLFCPSYQKLREGLSLNNDSHLANYIRQVLEIRMKLRLNR